MKRKIFTFLLCCAVGFTYAQDATVFGTKDVLIADFEEGGKTPLVTDGLWVDGLMTIPNSTQSLDLKLGDNPNPESAKNTSLIVGDYTRPAGGWRSLYIRLDKSVDFAKTPYFQFLINPVLGKSPVKGTTLRVWLKNDKDEIPSMEILSQWGDIPQGQWTAATSFLVKHKSSAKYNVIEIQINNGDSTANAGDTEYYIDQIGFKAPADGVALASTIFNENFGGYNANWSNGKVYRQIGWEKGYIAQFDSIGGFSSGIHFTCKNVAVDTASILWVREWGMGTFYDGYSGAGRLGLTPKYKSSLESGPIAVKDYTDLQLSFGFGTQQFWNDGDIAKARPKVEISVDGGGFYEVYSPSEFLLGIVDSLGNTTYQDQKFKWVEYPFTTIDGSPLSSVNTVNIRMSYGAGCESWVDDMWFAGKKTVQDGVSNPKSEAFSIYPNPATKYILTPSAQKVTITDLNGRIVNEAFNSDKVDVCSLANGAYIVKVKTVDSTKVGKLIKI